MWTICCRRCPCSRRAKESIIQVVLTNLGSYDETDVQDTGSRIVRGLRSVFATKTASHALGFVVDERDPKSITHEEQGDGQDVMWVKLQFLLNFDVELFSELYQQLSREEVQIVHDIRRLLLVM